MNIDRLMIIPQRDDLREYVKLAKENSLGFEYNDFFFPGILGDESESDKLIELYGLSENRPLFSTMHGAFFDVTVFSDDPLIKSASELRVTQSLEIAKKLGVKGVVFHTNYIPNFLQKGYRDAWVEKNAVFWKKKAQEYPMLDIYMENMFDTDWELIARLGSKMEDCPNFGICLDYAHAQVFGEAGDIEKWVVELAPYVKHLHINDNNLCEDMHQAVGDGSIDWQSFKHYHDKYFTEATVLIEVTGLEKIKQSLEYLSKL